MHIVCLPGGAFSPLLGEGANNFGGDMEEEYGCNKRERKDEDDERITMNG